jgi:hypothetical protein
LHACYGWMDEFEKRPWCRGDLTVRSRVAAIGSCVITWMKPYRTQTCSSGQPSVTAVWHITTLGSLEKEGGHTVNPLPGTSISRLEVVQGLSNAH